MNEANRAAGAGLVMSAGMATAAVGTAMAAGEVTGLTIRLTRQAVRAGAQGWDADGNYVCSAFIFNFRTMEVFDGSETHPISDITEWKWEDDRIHLYLKGRISPKTVAVGNAGRSETISRLLSAMWNGEVYDPDTKSLLRRPEARMRLPGVGTVVRYGLRSIFLGVPVWFLIKAGLDNYGTGNLYEYKGVVIGIFMLSLAWRLLRPLKLPRWRDT